MHISTLETPERIDHSRLVAQTQSTLCAFKLFPPLSLELTQAIQASFTPEPTVIVLNAVTDIKGWMANQTQPLHDHLKAHQFKFERNKDGECQMFYKEWSTDIFWLPASGLSTLPRDHPVPTLRPCSVGPCFDPEVLGKVEATIRKTGAYLNKAGTMSWWRLWIADARKYVTPLEP